MRDKLTRFIVKMGEEWYEVLGFKETDSGEKYLLEMYPENQWTPSQWVDKYEYGDQEIEIKIKATAGRGNSSIYECWKIANGVKVGSKYISKAFLKENEVTGRIREIEKFLNTPDGYLLYKKAVHTRVF